MPDRDLEFRAYFEARAAVLRRTAFLLCGDWHKAEDLAQTALVRLYVAWPRLHRDGQVDAYARKIVVRAAIDDSRRWFRRRETAMGEVPDIQAAAAPGVDDVIDVRRALAELPPGQRAAVVLRYWEDLPVAETAQLLGCSEGTVKSQAAKGLAALRRLLAAGRPVLREQS
ncbi:MAG TPA: SigE family RNA polymerase sigma factor [Actinophytocola sp.]|uniref:SigE family RNA polymerase sigma factor n=1 Tax=Actinophytocola sp. TaxID=1872138 RepID=UPI002DB9B7CF|nr:SigE family RNA polymerase sigma factor [Actinophytocola sp.]HEU5472172.1 SigE family RNA polymerase sigma factor [Actinophytocola sp.]